MIVLLYSLRVACRNIFKFEVLKSPKIVFTLTSGRTLMGCHFSFLLIYAIHVCQSTSLVASKMYLVIILQMSLSI